MIKEFFFDIYFNIFELLLPIIWFLSLLRITFFQLYFWQLKEYRLDRVLVHLKTYQGKSLFLDFFLLAKIIFFSLITFIFLNHFSNNLFKINGSIIIVILLIILFLVDLIYFFESLTLINDLIKRKFLRPKFTGKTFLITLFSFFLAVYIFFKIYDNFFIYGLLLVNILWPFLIIIIIFLLKPFIYFLKRQIIKKAKNKIRNFPKLKIIGITGSFGKSSTKEFLATILSEKFKVLKTPLNINTDIGVAKTILKQLTPEHEIFVVEMGAYKKGEIKAISELVKPQIGIITGINAQHLALFGNQENIIQTKSELIKSLPREGLAILNGDNQYCRQIAGKFNGKKLIYSQNDAGDIKAEDIKVEGENLEFKVRNQLIKVNLAGEYNISNLLAAILAALNLGMNLEEITRGIGKIQPSRGTMVIKKIFDNSFIIDDTYNSNPDGFFGALRHLKIFGDYYKLVITGGMLELGDEAKTIHQEVGRKIAEVADELIITNKNYSHDFKEGINNKIRVNLETKPSKIVELIKKSFNNKTVILLEGRLPSIILNNLKQ